jgi:hypothetical protein
MKLWTVSPLHALRLLGRENDSRVQVSRDCSTASLPMFAMGGKRTLNTEPFKAVRESLGGKIHLKHTPTGWR